MVNLQNFHDFLNEDSQYMGYYPSEKKTAFSFCENAVGRSGVPDETSLRTVIQYVTEKLRTYQLFTLRFYAV